MSVKHVEIKAIKLKSAVRFRNLSQERQIGGTRLKRGRGKDSKRIIHPKGGRVLVKH